MFYKLENNGQWLCGIRVTLPNGTVLDSSNKLEVGGWLWYDEEPILYTEWVNSQNIDNNV